MNLLLVKLCVVALFPICPLKSSYCNVLEVFLKYFNNSIGERSWFVFIIGLLAFLFWWHNEDWKKKLFLQKTIQVMFKLRGNRRVVLEHRITEVNLIVKYQLTAQVLEKYLLKSKNSFSPSVVLIVKCNYMSASTTWR